MTGARIMLIDDHPIVREGYRRLIERHPNYRVVGEGGDAAEAYRLYRELEPDIVIMDIALPGPGGIEATRHIRQCDGTARILIFTMHQGAAFALKAFQAGASGYVTKSSEPAELVRAIEAVLGGRRAISPGCCPRTRRGPAEQRRDRRRRTDAAGGRNPAHDRAGIDHRDDRRQPGHQSQDRAE